MRDTRSRPQAMPHWRDWGYAAAVTRVGGEMLGEKLNLRRREDSCFNCSTSFFVHFPIPETVIKCSCSWTTNAIKFPKSGLFCLQWYLGSGFPVFFFFDPWIFLLTIFVFSPCCWGGVNEQMCELLGWHLGPTHHKKLFITTLVQHGLFQQNCASIFQDGVATNSF